MPRSGSTWVYNAVRLLLLNAGVPDLAAGWVEDKALLLAHDNPIIKVHSFDAELALRADVVLTSHRDLRDVAASLQRKFKTPFSTQLLHQMMADYGKWSQLAAYDLHYEDLLTDRAGELKKIACALKLPSSIVARFPYAEILKEVDGEQFSRGRSTALGHDSINLLHEGHITDGRHGSWKDFLPPEVVAAIENEFQGWMVAKRYIA
ncbi:MAG TPA: hypothetical protein VFC07_14750 [Verrucomicrobiae bacterium]|nr:hypothetical protein [Verrucomicrobiae bacterium]